MTITEQINNVIRSVATGGERHTVVLDKAFATTVADLWDAITTPERLARWFESVDGELVEGGRYRLTGSGTAGTIERCDEPHALHVTWEFNGDVSKLDVTLTPEDDGTRLTLRHTVADNEHWQSFGPAATGIGWDGAFLALTYLLAGDRRAAPEEMAKFSDSDEGRDYIDATAELWRAAHVAGGADADRAREQAGKTATFYKGEA